MKLSRLAAGGAGLALVAGSLFAGATAATAATVYPVLPNPLPTESSPYAAEWFAGTVSGGDGTAVQSTGGLTITGGTNGFQLLNGTPASGPAGGLAAALDSAQVTAIGDAFFQVPVFGEPGAEFTTLRPVVATNLSGDWTTSQSVAGLTANAPYSKAALVAALDGGATAAQVLAFGVFVNAGDTVTIASIAFGADSHVFLAAPAVPTITVEPGTVTPEQLVDPGVNVTVSNIPSDEVFVSVTGPTGQVDEIGAFPVDETGTAVINIVWEGGTPPEGTYTVTVSYALSENSGDSIQTTFVVKKALAATGLDTTSTLLFGGLLLAAGAGVAVAAIRRKSAQA